MTTQLSRSTISGKNRSFCGLPVIYKLTCFPQNNVNHVIKNPSSYILNSETDIIACALTSCAPMKSTSFLPLSLSPYTIFLFSQMQSFSFHRSLEINFPRVTRKHTGKGRGQTKKGEVSPKQRRAHPGHVRRIGVLFTTMDMYSSSRLQITETREYQDFLQLYTGKAKARETREYTMIMLTFKYLISGISFHVFYIQDVFIINFILVEAHIWLKI